MMSTIFFILINPILNFLKLVRNFKYVLRITRIYEYYKRYQWQLFIQCNRCNRRLLRKSKYFKNIRKHRVNKNKVDIVIVIQFDYRLAGNS